MVFYYDSYLLKRGTQISSHILLALGNGTSNYTIILLDFLQLLRDRETERQRETGRDRQRNVIVLKHYQQLNS